MSNQEKHGMVHFPTPTEIGTFEFTYIGGLGFIAVETEKKPDDHLQEFGPVIKVEIIDLEVPVEVPVTIIEEKRVIRIDEMTWEDHKRGVANLHARFGLEMFN